MNGLFTLLVVTVDRLQVAADMLDNLDFVHDVRPKTFRTFKISIPFRCIIIGALRQTYIVEYRVANVFAKKQPERATNRLHHVPSRATLSGMKVGVFASGSLLQLPHMKRRDSRRAGASVYHLRLDYDFHVLVFPISRSDA